MYDIAALAAHKAQESGDLERWQQVLLAIKQNFKFLGTDESSLDLVIENSQSPEQLSVLMRLLYQWQKIHPQENTLEELIESSEASPFRLGEWLEGLVLACQWCEKHQQKILFPQMLEFVKCAQAGPDARVAGVSLAHIVADLLAVHGLK